MFRLTGILLFSLLTYQFLTQAAGALAREEGPSSCVDGWSKRTLFNIVWGCLSTTIICAWAAIHPNIPPREGPFKGMLRRLESMMWTIVAPEILPAWAVNQLLAAKTVRDVYNKGKGYEKESFGIWKTVKKWFSLCEIKEPASRVWTLKHGHFVVMGGIHLVEPPEEGITTTAEANTVSDQAASETTCVQSLRSSASVNADTEKGPQATPPGNELKPKEGRVTILTLEMLEELINDPEFEIPVTEGEITDKSKGDALSKIIFILQSTWFILQCLGRHAQGLDLTHVELTTLALASLNGITFVLWWDKPLGARAVVRLQLKRKLTDAERRVEGRGQSNRSDLVHDIQTQLEGRVTGVHDIILCRSKANRLVVDWLIGLPIAILLLLLWPILAFARVFPCTITDLLGGSTSFPADATHVPTFYVPKHRYYKFFHALLLIALGTLFGGIHCAAWNLPYPTYAEQQIWRVASLAVTIIPIAALALIFIIVLSFLAIFKSANEDILVLLTFALLLVYASARLVLLGQALALLRDLPPSTFIALDWTKFYPHFL